MPNKHGSMGRGGSMGHGGGNKREGQGGAIGQHRDATPDSADDSVLQRGRSESSPGHMKRDAGAQSARDYAPGRRDRAAGASAVLPEVAPDEMAED